MESGIRAGSLDFLTGMEGLSASYAIIQAEALGSAVLDSHGKILAATPNFARDIGQHPDSESLDPNLLAASAAIQLVTPSGDGVLTGLVVASLDEAAGWPTPPAILARARLPGAVVIALTATAGSVGAGFDRACRAFQLTPAQTRVARSLLLTGNVRAAARDLGIAYESAREAVSEAMAKVRVKKLAALIDRLTRLSFGIWPIGPVGEAVLMDLWGLTPRQATLALSIVEGMTRGKASATLGLSEATIKNELKVIYDVLGVKSSPGLARLIMEAQVLSLLTAATGAAVVESSDGPAPLDLAWRADGSLVAYSDFGPGSGAPVLVLHTSLACRSVPRRLVQALQAAGFRPISMDRAGYGLSDIPASPELWRADPFAAAVDDIETVADALNIGRFDLLCRGAAQVALATQKRIPDRVARVVLVNPDRPTDGTGGYRGPAAAVAEAFHRHPTAIERILNAFAHWLGKGLARRMLDAVIGDSIADKLAMSDPGNFAEFERGVRPFMTGRTAGVIAEQTALTRWTSPPVPGVAHWQVIQGEQDRMSSPQDAQAYWTAVLPGASVQIVADAGRFLTFSHPTLIADVLQGAPASAG